MGIKSNFFAKLKPTFKNAVSKALLETKDLNDNLEALAIAEISTVWEEIYDEIDKKDLDPSALQVIIKGFKQYYLIIISDDALNNLLKMIEEKVDPTFFPEQQIAPIKEIISNSYKKSYQVFANMAAMHASLKKLNIELESMKKKNKGFFKANKNSTASTRALSEVQKDLALLQKRISEIKSHPAKSSLSIS